MKVLYIAGAGRSGSTLMSRLLGEVEGFVNVGEATGHILNRDRRNMPIPCGCGHPLERCDFWGDLLPRVDENGCLGRRFGRLRAMPGLLGPFRSANSDAVAAYRAAAEALLLDAGAAAGCDVVVESSKVPANALILAGASEIELFVVHLVRDASGFIASRSADKAYLRRMSPFKAAAVWSASNLASETLRRRVANYAVVRYEDFVAAPEAYLRRLVRYATGESRDLGFLDGSVARISVQHIVAGNPDKLDGGEVVIRCPQRPRLGAVAWFANLPTVPLNSRYRRARNVLPEGP